VIPREGVESFEFLKFSFGLFAFVIPREGVESSIPASIEKTVKAVIPREGVER